MKYLLLIPICLLGFLATNCENGKNVKTQENVSAENKTFMVSAPIVFKNFVAKNGSTTDKIEPYIRLSVQDYFIKFCESKISADDFEKYLSEIDGEIKSITAEIEIRDGYWDICSSDINGEIMIQSRIGEYAVIHKIIEPGK